jgi:hypothetical protein
MIRITVTEGESVRVKIFPSNEQGTQASVKFIKQLYKDRTKDGWFYNLHKIQQVKERLASVYIRKKRVELEEKLKFLVADREELLEILGIESPPPSISIAIIHK